MSKKVSHLICEIKYVRRGIFRMHYWVNYTETISDAWVHMVFYYRYNPTKYDKWVIDIWENLCDWVDGTYKSHILSWVVGPLLKYTNLNHPCPYDEPIYLKVDNISTDNFPIEQLFPAGRYRLDANITEGNKKNVLIKGQLFFSISDHRLEKF